MRPFVTFLLCLVFITLGENLQAQDACKEDINGDSQINVTDYLLLVGRFGETCPVFSPVVLSFQPDSILSSGFRANGRIASDGGSPLLFTGFCYATTPNTTILSSKNYAGTDTGNFSSFVPDLQPATTYFVKAYATNGVGTSYGSEFVVTTLPNLPEVVTAPVTSITRYTAVSGGEVLSDGGSPVVLRGICWSTSPSPTVLDNVTSDGSGIGTFTSSLTGLVAGTRYYVRSYATNSAGTAYGQEINFYSEFPALVAIDGDGNVYQVDTIGNQIWISENLRTTSYNDGTPIPHITLTSDWNARTQPAYCWFNNDETANKLTYGALYNWYTTQTGKLCPTGWHVPDDTEWLELTTYLGGDATAGGKLKETGTSHWLAPNTGATDEVGYTARPGGYRRYNGTFSSLTLLGYWWSVTEALVDHAWERSLQYNSSAGVRNYSHKRNGFSVRCLKD